MKNSIYSLSLFLAGMFLIGQQALAQNPDPEVTVIQPDKKNIEWVIGETYLISWTDNFVNTVDIWLLENDVPLKEIDTEVEGSTYEWFIDPNGFVAGEDYKVRVQSSVNPTYQDDSRWEFSLVTSASNAFIKVEQPNVRNIKWVRGNEYLISWTDNIEGSMDIFLVKDATYLANDETTWTEIETAVEGSTYTWMIPANTELRSDYRILVTDENREVKDLSNKTFSIVETGGTITVLQPNVRNIEWIYGNEYLISWNRTTTGTFDLYLIKDYSDWSNATPFDPTDLIEIETDVEGTTYSWEIDDAAIEALVPGTEFRIMVRSTGSDIYDISNKNFSIVAYSGFIHVEQPNVRNITWVLGTEHLISWLDNIDSDMNIYLVNDATYDENDPNTWTEIELGVPGTTYTWDIDSNLEPRDDYRVLITTPDAPNYTVKDISNKTFSLVEYDGEITVIQPNIRGIEWIIGNEYLISWTDNVDAPLDIELISEDPIILYSDNASNSPYADGLDDGDNGGNGFEDWEISTATVAGGTAITMVADPSSGGINGMTNPSFGIIGYGNTLDVGNTILARREFISAMEPEQTLSFDWAVRYYNGEKGFRLTGGATVLIEVSITNNDDIKITFDGNTSVMFDQPGVEVMNLSFEYTIDNQLRVYGIGRDGSESFNDTFDISTFDAPDAIEFYSFGHSDNQFINRVNWFNNLQIYTFKADIATDVEGSTYVWNTAGYSAGSYKIRVFKGEIEDYSNKTFELVLSGGGDLDFNQPSAGDVWYKGVAYWIIWEDDIMEPLDIYLKNDVLVPAVDILIASDYEGSMIDYLVPTNNTVPVGDDYYIQIVSTLDPSMHFESGIFEISEQIMAAIFPNPASQYFNVQFDEQLDGIFDVTIFDRFNNRMLETRLDAANKQHRINTAALPEGFYFVQMVNGDKTITKKIVVKH